MSNLGQCPTCNNQISITANFCPHCGEREFYAGMLKNSEVIKCIKCGGTGMDKQEICSTCEGKKYLTRKEYVPVDLRRLDPSEANKTERIILTKKEFQEWSIHGTHTCYKR